MSRLTQVEAAFEVLRLAKRPMRADEIRLVAIQNGLLRDASSASITVALHREIRNGGRFVRLRNGFGLREWESNASSELTSQLLDATLQRGLRRWLRQVREVLADLSPAPSADILCLWMEACYRLELRTEARGLFHRIIDSEADPWLFKRARGIYRLCQDEST
jgi:hypothetical protein